MGKDNIKEMETNNLRQLRKEKNLSLRELQDQIGINFNTIGMLERGEMELTPKYLEMFSDFYNVSYDYLLNRTKNELQNMNYPTQKIEELLATAEFQDALQKQIICMITLLTDDEDKEIINQMVIHLLKQKGIKYKQELKEKYLIDYVA